MRVAALEVQQFGALHGRRFSTDADTVVVYGRNERGKSSFHQALRTALFGFSPATAKLHPMASDAFASGSDQASDEPLLAVSATLHSASGSLTIERRMDRAASSRLTLGGAAARDAAFVRANEPIEGVGAVTAGLFQEVYTLDPDSTRAFDRRLAPAIEHLLLGGSAVPGLPTVGELKQSIDAERASLWREDRRSKKTVVALIDAQLAALQAEGRETRAVEEGLLRLESQLEAGAARLAADEEALADTRRRIAALSTIERAARIAQSALDHDVDLKPLAGVPLESPVPMLSDLEDAELALEEPVQRLSEPALALDPSDAAALQHREAIAGLAREEAKIERARTEARAHALRAEEKRAAAREVERPLREGGEGETPDEGLRQLHALSADWSRRAAADAAGSAAVPEIEPGLSPAASWSIGAAAGAVAGGAALAGGAHWAGALAGAVAAAAAPAAAAAIAQGKRPSPGRSSASSAQPPPPRDLDPTLRGLGMAPALVATPRELEGLVQTLGRAAALRDEARELEATEERFLQAIDTEHERWRALDVALRGGFEKAQPSNAERPAWDSVDDVPEILRARLERAEERARAFKIDAEERRRATREKQRAAARLQGVSERFETLREALEAAIPGETVLERAFERVADAHAAAERARGALVELRAEEAWALAKDDPRLAQALNAGEFDASELRALKDEADDLEQGILGLREELARLDERLRHERPKRTRSSIDSRAMELKAKRAEAMERHRNLTELGSAIAEGEERHRAAHQPSILRGAGRWLEAITDGRYRSLRVDTSEGVSLEVESREAGGFVPCEPPLSRGVREQVHLALRMGVADAADAGGEPLPLLLDEALVHWDEARRAGLYRALLARRSAAPKKARQAFLFTCHEALASEAVEQLGALRIDL